MAWSHDNATRAYLETIRLCKLDHQRRYTSLRHSEPHSTEFIAALAAGMSSQLILEICLAAAPSTIALAVAARQTGGKLVCVLLDPNALHDAAVAMKELNLSEVVEFVTGDVKNIVTSYSNVDFALMDCKVEDYMGIMDVINLNPQCAVMVADNLLDRKSTTAYGNFVRKRAGTSSIALPIGKGIKVTRYSGAAELTRRPLNDIDNFKRAEGFRRLKRREAEKARKAPRMRFFIETEVNDTEWNDSWF